MSAHGDRRGGLVYHWKHGWIPLDHFAALSKAKGSHKGAEKVMAKHGITPPHKGPAVAKRGDVVVVTRKTSSFTTGPGGGYKAGEEHHVGVATSVTRDGKVKTADVVWGSSRSKLTIDHRQHTVHVVGGPDKINVEGALAAAAANPWPHAPEHKGKAFDSLDQVRAALAPHRKSGTAVPSAGSAHVAGKAPTVGAKVHIGTDVRYHGQGTVTSVDHATKTAIVNMNGRSGRVAFDQVHGSKLEAQAKVKSTFGSGSLADMGGNKAAKKLARQEPAVGVPLPKGYKLTGGGSAGYTLHHPDGTSQHAGNSQLGAAKLARQHLSGGGTSRRTPLDPALVKDLRGGSADKHLVTDGTGTHFTAERAALHDKIVNDIVGGAEKGHDKPSFVMLGGGPASGKTKAAQQAAHDFPGAVTINPDDIKAMLPEYAKMGEKAASFTHEESSYLAKRANAAAMAQRSHIILDAVGDTSVKSVEGKVAQARAHGYATHARYVTVPTETAQARALLRGQRSGRFVPPAVIDHAHAGVSDVFPKVVGRFDTATLHDNTDQWTHVMSAAGGQTTVHAPALYQAFLHKAGGDF